VKIAKWGNSLAIRLPATLVDDLGLKEGDDVQLRRAPDGALDLAVEPSVEEWFDRVRAMGPLVPAGYAFKRRDAYPSAGFHDDAA
jgi:antitoxin MazE